MPPPLPPLFSPPRPSLEPASAATPRRATVSASNRAQSPFRESLSQALHHDSRPERSAQQNPLESRGASIDVEAEESISDNEIDERSLGIENHDARDDVKLNSDAEDRADPDRGQSSDHEATVSTAVDDEPGSNEVAQFEPGAAQEQRPDRAGDAPASNDADAHSPNSPDKSSHFADTAANLLQIEPLPIARALAPEGAAASTFAIDAASVQAQPLSTAPSGTIGPQPSAEPVASPVAAPGPPPIPPVVIAQPIAELPGTDAAAPLPASDTAGTAAPTDEPGLRADSPSARTTQLSPPPAPMPALALPSATDRFDSPLSAAPRTASPQLASLVSSADVALNAASITASDQPEPQPHGDQQSQQRSSSTAASSNQRFFAFPQSDAPPSPAAARAAQVDVAVRLENATGMAASQDAAAVRTVQSSAGAHSNQGHGFTAQGDTPLPSSAHNAGFEDDRFSSRIVRGLNAMLNQRGGVMLMRLDPPELGQLRVQMTIQRGVVTAQFDAASPEARALLDKSMAVLRTALESHGLTVERLAVNHAPASTPGAWSDDRSGANSQQHSSRHDAGGEQSRGRRDDPATRFEPQGPDDEQFATSFDRLTSSSA